MKKPFTLKDAKHMRDALKKTDATDIQRDAMLQLIDKRLAEDSPSHNPVDHPSHYTKGRIECIDGIKAALTEEEFRGFCKGNVLKYIWRERNKNGIEDLKKSQFYLNKLISTYEESK